MECLMRRVVLAARMRPRVPIIRNHIAPMANGTIIKEIIRLLYNILQTYANPNPPHKLDNLNPPSTLILKN